jgi:predicted permease
MSRLHDDVRHAFRRLRHQPGFALTVILTLALGLGANIAIFTLMDALLMRALPVRAPDELVRLGDTNNCCVNSGLQGSYSLFSSRLFEHLRAQTADQFIELAAFQANAQPTAVRRSGGETVSVLGQFVTANYFDMFGVQPAAGRLLQAVDDAADAAPAAVLSHEVWTQQFGRDSSIVGSTVLVNGKPMTVVGVTAAGFFGDTVRMNPPGIWLPMGQEPAQRGQASIVERVDQDWLYAIGRVRPGATPAAISVRSTAALRQWLGAQSFLSETGRSRLAEQQVVAVAAGGGVPVLQNTFAQSLTVLFVTSGLVLLIATANLANLLLARADRGQAAIRAALGASASRLMRQSVTEGIVLALAGGVVAVFVASVAARALVILAFPGATLVPFETASSPLVWAFALGLAVVTGALFSAGPAWAMSRTSPLDALSGIGRSSQVRAFVPRRSLVVAQAALSFILLTGAGLLSGTLGQLEQQTLGFEPEGRTIVRIDPPAIAGERERVAAFYTAIRERLLRVPGVRDASFALYSPMEGNNWSSGISIAGRSADPAAPAGSSWNRVGPRYFETTGTRVLRGRPLDERDMIGGARVVVVNDAFRRQFFETGDAVGQRVGIGGPAHAGDYEIVGVVEDVRYAAPRQAVRPMIFLPAFQAVEYADGTSANVQARSMLMRAIIVHAAAESGALEPALRSALMEVDPNLHIIGVRPHAEQVSGNFRIERLMARLTTIYGLLALALASVGLYGVTAFGVAQRTREIGVRMALGADRSRIVRTVVRGPVLQTIVGLLVGIPVALWATRFIAAQLYGVNALDPIVIGGAALVLIASSVLAALLPALRAASISPTDALRS